MDVSVVINSARRFLSDSGATPRWLDADFFAYAEDAEREIIRLRPSLLLDPAVATDVMRTYVGGYTATNDPMFFDENWKTAITDYMCFKALEEDNSDTSNILIARECLSRFIDFITGKGSS